MFTLSVQLDNFHFSNHSPYLYSFPILVDNADTKWKNVKLLITQSDRNLSADKLQAKLCSYVPSKENFPGLISGGGRNKRGGGSEVWATIVA